MTHLEFAQPDEPADISGHGLGQQRVQTFTHVSIKPTGDTRFNVALRCNQCIST